jgi:hypothetical protein
LNKWLKLRLLARPQCRHKAETIKMKIDAPRLRNDFGHAVSDAA